MLVAASAAAILAGVVLAVLVHRSLTPVVGPIDGGVIDDPAAILATARRLATASEMPALSAFVDAHLPGSEPRLRADLLAVRSDRALADGNVDGALSDARGAVAAVPDDPALRVRLARVFAASASARRAREASAMREAPRGSLH